MLDLQKNHHLPILYTSFYTFPSLSLSLFLLRYKLSDTNLHNMKADKPSLSILLSFFLSFFLSFCLPRTGYSLSFFSAQILSYFWSAAAMPSCTTSLLTRAKADANTQSLPLSISLSHVEHMLYGTLSLFLSLYLSLSLYGTLSLFLSLYLSLYLDHSLMWSTSYMVHSLSFSLSISQACAHTHTQAPVRSRISRSLFFCVALEAAATTTPMATTATPMATTGNSRSSTIGFSMHLGAVCCLQNVFIYQKHFLSTAATTYAS